MHYNNLLQYLKEQYKRTSSKDSYVFLNDKDEHYYDIKRIRNTKWKNLLKECSIEFATIMIENNEGILWDYLGIPSK